MSGFMSGVLSRLKGLEEEEESDDDYDYENDLVDDLSALLFSPPGYDERPRSYSPPITSPFCCSVTPFSKLNIASVASLRVDERATGSYLLLRSFQVTVKGNVIYLTVKDHKGKSSRCQIFNYVFLNKAGGQGWKDEFPNKTVFVIKEPWLKRCFDGSACLFVTTPSDIFIVTRDHSLFEQALKFRLINATCDPKSALEWKEKGNEFFRAGNYFKAIEAYSMGLKVDHDEGLFTALQLNLAVTYLSTECYESCLDSASKVLRKEQANEKALFRAGRANYELGEYDDALECFKRVLVGRANKKAIYELGRCLERLEEREGKIDAPKLCESIRLNLVELGTHLGPVRIGPVPGKGRGVIATEDLKPGTLVVVEKAFALFPVLVEEQEEKHEKRLNNCAGIAEVVRKVYLNPNTFGRKFFDLYSGKQRETNEKRFCDDEDQTEPVVDMTKVWDIIDLNGYADPSLTRSRVDVKLFLTAPYLNHSCLCNSITVVMKDVIMVRTVTMVRKGEEVTISYESTPDLPLTPEDNPEFSCTCKFCELERSDPEDVKAERASLLTNFKMLAVYADAVCGRGFRKSEMRSTVWKLEKSYRGRDKLKTALCDPYFVLARNLKAEDPTLAKKAKILDLADKALKCMGLSMDILISCTKNPNSYLPADAFLTKFDMLCHLLVLIASVQTRPEDVDLWRNVYRMIRKTYPIEPS